MRACVRGWVGAWWASGVHERGHLLERVYAYLSSIPRSGAILFASSLAPPYFST